MEKEPGRDDDGRWMVARVFVGGFPTYRAEQSDTPPRWGEGGSLYPPGETQNIIQLENLFIKRVCG